MSSAKKRGRSVDEIDASTTEVAGDDSGKKFAAHSISESLPSASSSHLRDAILPKDISEVSDAVKIVTFNVNGLKAVSKKNVHIINNLIQKHSPDIICLQETKIQPCDIGEVTFLFEHYECFWNCSEIKKGYAGTAILIHKSTVKNNATANTSKSSGKVIHSGTTAEIQGINNNSQTSKSQAKLTSFFTKKGGAPQPESPKVSKSKSSTDSASTVPKLTLQSVHFDFDDYDGKKRFEGEGRTITMIFDRFVLINAYVPNSGDGLVRLNYRVNEWDPFLREYLNHQREKNIVSCAIPTGETQSSSVYPKSVIYTGDLNVAHLDLDVHNPGAKHIAKQAGLTPQERSSMSALLTLPLPASLPAELQVASDPVAQSALLAEEGVVAAAIEGAKVAPDNIGTLVGALLPYSANRYSFVDAFRYLYPDARGQFTYWSQRTFARPVNKGLRLDYFLCSNDMLRSPKTSSPIFFHQEINENPSIALSKKSKKETSNHAEILNKVPGVLDCYSLHGETVGCSDHCPVILILQL